MRTTKEFVESIMPAIMGIHGGCDGCIQEFLQESKKAMAEEGIEIISHWDAGRWSSLRLEVKEI
jgi:hypothetical protein